MAYTWSKDLTTQSAGPRCEYSTYQYDFKLDYGPSTYNQPHTFTANYVYDLPFFVHQSGLHGQGSGRLGGLGHRAVLLRAELLAPASRTILGIRMGTHRTRVQRIRVLTRSPRRI